MKLALAAATLLVLLWLLRRHTDPQGFGLPQCDGDWRDAG